MISSSFTMILFEILSSNYFIKQNKLVRLDLKDMFQIFLKFIEKKVL